MEVFHLTTLHENAWAKLNISLDVAERRPDGYHDMTMVMQTVSLCDSVDISFNDSGRVQAKTSLSFVPGDARNLAVKAALCYLHAAGLDGQGMLITLDKKVPVGAGMGGSAQLTRVMPAALEGNYQPGFMAEHLRKDLMLALGAAEDMELSMPATETALNLVDMLCQVGGGRLGTQALALLYADEATSTAAGLDWGLVAADPAPEQSPARQRYFVNTTNHL